MVCVPIDPKHASEFDFAAVPTLTQLHVELDAHGGEVSNVDSIHSVRFQFFEQFIGTIVGECVSESGKAATESSCVGSSDVDMLGA